MKKIATVLVVLLLLGVGYFLMSSKKIAPKNPVESENKNSGSGNVFTSIKDALSKSMSLKCVYKDENGIETITYIKGGAVRVMMTTASTDKEEPNNIVLKDKKIYMWNEKSKKGFTYTITEPKVSPSQGTDKLPKTTGDKNESVIAGIEKYKDACKVEVIADSFFQIPTDVKFQDMSAFTENLMKQTPTNAEGQNTANQDYINNLMKQVTPPADEGQ